MDWSALPLEIVDLISKKIAAIGDYVRFRAACKPWRSGTEQKPRHLPPQAPWLVLPYDVDSPSRSFLSVPDMKVHRFILPEARRRRFFGFDHGWLVTVGLTPDVNLMNPLTRDQIELPPVTTIPQVYDYDGSAVGREYALHFRGERASWGAVKMRDAFFYKVVLSSNPTVVGGECVAMAFHSHNERVAFCRVGDTRWTVVETGLYDMPIDARYFQGKFFALSVVGRVAVWGGRPSGKVRSVPAFEGPTSRRKFCFVESSGRLFVMRITFLGDDRCVGEAKKRGFEFVEMEGEARPRCTKVRGIGEEVALFLDGQHCLAVSGGVGGHGSPGFLHNHMYTFENLYTDGSEEPQERTRNVFVVNMGNGKGKLLPFTWEPDGPLTEKVQLPWEDILGGQRRHVWFTPSLC